MGLLLAAGAPLAYHPGSRRAARAAALLLAGLIASYAAATTVGMPLLSVEQESFDGVGLVTKLVESAGLGPALKLDQSVGGLRPRTREEVTQ